MTVEKIWRDILTTKVPGGALARLEEIAEITGIMTVFRIDPQAFAGNLMQLFKGRNPFGTVSDRSLDIPSTVSVLQLANLSNPPAPLWVLAAVPDVIVWLKDYSRRLDPNDELDDMPPEMLRLYGLQPSDLDSIRQEEAINVDGWFLPRFYASLIRSYVAETGRRLETAVSNQTQTNIYSGTEFFQSLGVEDNYALIAKMTTIYYRELKRKYPDRFPYEVVLLATAGALDAQIYINQTSEISLEQVKQLASAASGSASPLLEFIIRLETLLLTVDTPQYTRTEVESAVRQNTQRIQEVIEDTMRSAEVPPLVARSLDDFMNKRRNDKAWSLLGVAHK